MDVRKFKMDKGGSYFERLFLGESAFEQIGIKIDKLTGLLQECFLFTIKECRQLVNFTKQKIKVI